MTEIPRETRLALSLGLPSWPAVVAAVRRGRRFTFALPPNGDTSVEGFVYWNELLAREQLVMLADGKGQATLGDPGSFSRAELAAAEVRLRAAVPAAAKPRPPWVQANGEIDPSYLPASD